MRFRRSELLLDFFFLYMAAAAFAIGVPPGTRSLIVTLNVALAGWSCLFAWAHPGRGFHLLDRVRDWWPLAGLLVALRETSWLSLVRTPGEVESTLIQWDRAVLADSGLKLLLDAGTPVVPGALELAYLLAAVLPVVMVALFYAAGERDRLDDAWSIVLLAVLSVFAIWPWMPMEPPRLVFPGELLPPQAWPRQLTLAVVNYAGGRTGAFPSARVALAFAVPFALLRLLKGRLAVGLAGLALAFVVALAAVYCRYHYAADVVAGFVVACVAGIAGLVLTRAVKSPWEGREEMF
ncbi:MAG: phosphatase PAP2 family protein [Bryobacteraceae bacterium]|jgi:membrane-associated phospholipid phosphatase